MFDRMKQAIHGLVEKRKENALVREKCFSYKNSVMSAVGGATIDPAQVAALTGLQNSLDLNPEMVGRVHRDVLIEIARSSARRSDQITEEEIEGLKNVSNFLGVPSSEIPRRQAGQLENAEILMGIRNGKLPELHDKQIAINQQPGEVIHATVRCHVLDERVWLGHVGRSHGYSVRIARGVYYHTGQSRGRTIPHSEIVPVDSGDFTITSQRLVYVGIEQNISAAWPKVLFCEPASNGIAIAFTNRKKTTLLKYADHSKHDIIEAVIAHYMA